MIDFVFVIFLLGTLICEMIFVAIIYRLATVITGSSFPERLLEKLDGAWAKRREFGSDSRPIEPGKSGGKFEVETLPPEIIAPKLKKPPRPPGGFGSRTGQTKRDTQLHQKDDSVARTESGPDQKGGTTENTA